MTKYVLPDLDYDYSALEPHIAGTIMELHHDKHHAAYVKGANSTLEQLEEARTKGDFARIAALERALAFHLSGHVLHSIFWQNLTPRAEEKPATALGEAIARDFGSFQAFKKQMNQAAATIMGSGWAALVWEPVAKRLATVQIYDHQSNVAQSSVPLMVLDAWEHAYYLQYQNRKGEFFDAVWRVWDWTDVGERFEAAQRLDLVLAGISE